MALDGANDSLVVTADTATLGGQLQLTGTDAAVTLTSPSLLFYGNISEVGSDENITINADTFVNDGYISATNSNSNVIIKTKNFTNYGTFVGAGTVTFVYDRGNGSLDMGSVSIPNLELEFGDGISAADITVTQDDEGSLFLHDGVSGDLITLDHVLAGIGTSIKGITFADGTSWTEAQLLARETVMSGTTAGDTLSSVVGRMIFDGKGATSGSSDYERGIGGGDSFIYDPGYGNLEVFEYGGKNAGDNTLKLGVGIDKLTVSVSSIDSDDLIVSDGIAGDAVTLDNERLGTPWGVQRVQFADGTTWTQDQLAQLVSASPSSSVTITDAVPLTGATLSADTIETVGSGNSVGLGAGVAAVTGGSSDTITVDGTDLTLSGASQDTVFLGDAACTVDDLSTATTFVADSLFRSADLLDVASDSGFVVDLKGGLGGFESADDVVGALQSDGNGGTLLMLGSGDGALEIDFIKTSASALTAAHFAIG